MASRCRPEPASAVDGQAPGRQHHARRGQVDLDPIERVSGLRQPVGRGRQPAEQWPLDVGELRVDVLVEVQDVPDGRDHHHGQDQPGPVPAAARSRPDASRRGIRRHVHPC